MHTQQTAKTQQHNNTTQTRGLRTADTSACIFEDDRASRRGRGPTRVQFGRKQWLHREKYILQAAVKPSGSSEQIQYEAVRLAMRRFEFFLLVPVNFRFFLNLVFGMGVWNLYLTWLEKIVGCWILNDFIRSKNFLFKN